MFMDGLDELDQKIVSLLIRNARMSYSEIGQQVGISRVAVKMRVQALEQKGIIEEYTTIINPQKISGAVSCYFEIETKPDMLAEVAEILKKNDTITQIYRVTGKSRLHVHAVASSNEEMEELICNTMDNLPGVVACTCNTILSVPVIRYCPESKTSKDCGCKPGEYQDGTAQRKIQDRGRM